MTPAASAAFTDFHRSGAPNSTSAARWTSQARIDRAGDLYQLPRIAETVDMAQIKRHYYTTHDMINPSRIIPAGPKLDFLAPHNRG